MKKGVHPDNYRPVVFQDSNNQTTFLTRSTAPANETIELDGVSYPLIKVHISSSSHPFFTGEERILDVEGRVDKFKARQKVAQKARETKATSQPKQKKTKSAAQKLGSTSQVVPKNKQPES